MKKRKKGKGLQGVLCLCFCFLLAARPVAAAQKENLFLIPDYEKSGLFPAGRARNGYLLADDKLYLDTEKELFRLDMKTGEAVSLLPFEKESPGCEGDFCKWGQYLYVAENTAQGGKLWKVDETTKKKELLKTPGYDRIWEVHVQEGRLYFWGNRGNGSYLYSGYELKRDGTQGKKLPYEDAQITFIEKKLPLKENTQILYAEGHYALGLLPAENRPGQEEKYYGIVTEKGSVSELSFSKPVRIDGLDRHYFYYHYNQVFGGLERVVYCRQPLPGGGPRDMIGIFSEGQVWDLAVIGEQVYYKLKKADGSIWLMRFPSDQETIAAEEAACLQEAVLTAEQKAAQQEAARKAEEEEAKREAVRKAEEEEAKREAARKAEEEEAKREAVRKAEEEEAKREAVRKAEKQAEYQTAKTSGSRTDKSGVAESNADQSNADKSNADNSNADKSSADKSNADNSNADKSNADNSNTGKNDTNKNSADKSKRNTAAASSADGTVSKNSMAQSSSKEKSTAPLEDKAAAAARQETGSSAGGKLFGTGRQADGRIRELLQEIWKEQYPEREWREDSCQIAFQNSAYIDILLPGETQEQDSYLFFDRRDGSLLTILDVVDCDLDTLQQHLERIFHNFREYPGFKCNVRVIEKIELLPVKEGLKIFLDTGGEHGKISGILRYEDIDLRINCKTS